MMLRIGPLVAGDHPDSQSYSAISVRMWLVKHEQHGRTVAV